MFLFFVFLGNIDLMFTTIGEAWEGSRGVLGKMERSLEELVRKAFMGHSVRYTSWSNLFTFSFVGNILPFGFINTVYNPLATTNFPFLVIYRGSEINWILIGILEQLLPAQIVCKLYNQFICIARLSTGMSSWHL